MNHCDVVRRIRLSSWVLIPPKRDTRYEIDAMAWDSLNDECSTSTEVLCLQG